MTEPDDRELEQYLKGDSRLSRRYREVSGESAPPELDEAVLARARAELRRRPQGVNRWLTPVALAASVVLGVNLGWNVYKAEPQPREARQALEEAAAPRAEAPASRDSGALAAREDDLARRNAEYAESLGKAKAERARVPEQEQKEEPGSAAASSDRAAVAPASAPAPKAILGEPEKIDRLIAFVGRLQGAMFIRNGAEHGPAEAAKHLQLKRDKAGDRVRSAEDFIRLCASHSYLSGEAYLIRFADGRTRTAEDVLREELARIESAQ